MRFNYSFSQENIDIDFIRIVFGILIALTVIFCGLLFLDGKSYYAHEKIVFNENADYINALPLKKNATDAGGSGVDMWIGSFNRVPVNNKISSQTPSYAGGISSIKGWAVDSFAGTPLFELYAKIGNRLFKAYYGNILWNATGVHNGFELYFPEEIINGAEEISFIGISAGGLYKYEPVIYKIQEAIDTAYIVSNAVLENIPVRNKQTLMFLDYVVDNILMAEKKTISLRDGTDLHMGGWAADVDAGKPLKSLYVKIHETLFECEYGGIERPDVSDVFENPDLLRTGFRVTIPAKYLNDVTAVSFIMLGTDGTYQYDPIVYRIIATK
jgi:hypothetical protein